DDGARVVSAAEISCPIKRATGAFQQPRSGTTPVRLSALETIQDREVRTVPLHSEDCSSVSEPAALGGAVQNAIRGYQHRRPGMTAFARGLRKKMEHIVAAAVRIEFEYRPRVICPT